MFDPSQILKEQLLDLPRMGYTRESQLVGAAQKDVPEACQSLRTYALTLTRRVAAAVVAENQKPSFSVEILVTAGMEEFDASFAAYTRRWPPGREARYKFSTYFMWRVKRAMDQVLDA